MTYSDQASLSQDQDFLFRCAACAAVEIETTNPVLWATEHVWTLAAAPGFADAYASALAGGVPRPGNDPAVISDAQILAAVQALEAAGAPDAEQSADVTEGGDVP